MHRTLDAARIVATVETLERRIAERFAGSGLSQVAAALSAEARATADRAAALNRPDVALRIGVGAVLTLGVAAQVYSATHIRLGPMQTDALSLAQGLEAAFNLLAIFGAAIWFLLTLEERMKRRRVLARLHELRSLAHVVDMHQLTKDPTIILANLHRRTTHSPARPMSRFELTRYLEYCSEMLALIGKLAALYAEGNRDAVVIDAVNDIESLATSLGRKIWQKITIIGQLEDSAERA